MSNKNKVKQNKKLETKSNKVSYKNPSDTVWGKIVLWALIFGMAGSVIVGLILALINSNA
jgi:hypothetical protein